MGISDYISHKTRVVSILDSISLPTSPFNERLVQAAIRELISPLLKNENVQFNQDRYGNFLLSYWNAQKPSLPCLAVAAHMDHPGFTPIKSKGKQMEAVIMGGLPRGDDLIGTRVIIVDNNNNQMSGVVKEYADKDQNRVVFQLDSSYSGDLDGFFAVPDLDKFKISNGLIHGIAMDDLAGCAIQLAVFERIVRDELPVDFMAVFHRAEEVGFIGAVGVCELKSIPPNAIVISLEASKELDTVHAGDGVVIRTGDKLYEFDRNAQRLLESAAEKAETSGASFQKHRMDGGTCEASLYLAHGYQATALALPLLNYHNHGDGKLQAEAISIFDLNTAVELLHQAALLLPDYEIVPYNLFVKNRQRTFDDSKHKLLNFKI